MGSVAPECNIILLLLLQNKITSITSCLQQVILALSNYPTSSNWHLCCDSGQLVVQGDYSYFCVNGLILVVYYVHVCS